MKRRKSTPDVSELKVRDESDAGGALSHARQGKRKEVRTRDVSEVAARRNAASNVEIGNGDVTLMILSTKTTFL